MYRPENNAIALDDLGKVVVTYPPVDCFIYDRACKAMEDVVTRKKKLSNIRTYTADKFHAPRRKANCAANSFAHSRPMRRTSNLNTGIAGQTLSWFRGYARSMDAINPLRRPHIVLLYAEMHKELLSRGIRRAGTRTHTGAYRRKDRFRTNATP